MGDLGHSSSVASGRGVNPTVAGHCSADCGRSTRGLVARVASVNGATTARPLEELVREHAALRRVATLVAQEPSPSEVFAAVTKEAGMLLGAQRATLLRVESPQWAVVVAGWSDGALPPVPVGHRGALDGRGILGQMLQTARPVRIEDFDAVGDGAVADLMRDLGIRAGAGGPIIIGGRVWGAVTAVWE